MSGALQENQVHRPGHDPLEIDALAPRSPRQTQCIPTFNTPPCDAALNKHLRIFHLFLNTPPQTLSILIRPTQRQEYGGPPLAYPPHPPQEEKAAGGGGWGGPFAIGQGRHPPSPIPTWVGIRRTGASPLHPVSQGSCNMARSSVVLLVVLVGCVPHSEEKSETTRDRPTPSNVTHASVPLAPESALNLMASQPTQVATPGATNEIVGGADSLPRPHPDAEPGEYRAAAAAPEPPRQSADDAPSNEQETQYRCPTEGFLHDTSGPCPFCGRELDESFKVKILGV